MHCVGVAYWGFFLVVVGFVGRAVFIKSQLQASELGMFQVDFNSANHGIESQRVNPGPIQSTDSRWDKLHRCSVTGTRVAERVQNNCGVVQLTHAKQQLI